MKDKMNIALFAGTRPEIIKLAPIIRELEKFSNYFKSYLIVTGQHRELLAQMLTSFEITPEIDFHVMEPNQALSTLTAKILKESHNLLSNNTPDFIISQGDTVSAFSAALVSYFFKIPYGHVEAGLRTYNKYQPFPEEGLRRLIDSICDFYWTPTKSAAENLLNEGIKQEQIFITGNTVIDSLLLVSSKIEDRKLPELIPLPNGRKRILVTIHRRENWGLNVEMIFTAFRNLIEQHRNIEFVYPVHFTPAVRQAAEKLLRNIERIHLIEPLDYFSFIALMKQSAFIVTDSGGIQEEAPALGKPVLVLREVTERPEGIEAGTAKLVKLTINKIEEAINELIMDDAAYSKMANSINPYGDGKAAERIVASLRAYFFDDCLPPEPFNYEKSK